MNFSIITMVSTLVKINKNKKKNIYTIYWSLFGLLHSQWPFLIGLFPGQGMVIGNTVKQNGSWGTQ
jgi:hypothetical protein